MKNKKTILLFSRGIFARERNSKIMTPHMREEAELYKYIN